MKLFIIALLISTASCATTKATNQVMQPSQSAAPEQKQNIAPQEKAEEPSDERNYFDPDEFEIRLVLMS